MDIRINLPAILQSHYADYEVSQNISAINNIKNRYGSFVRQAAAMSNVPEELIYSFIFIESSGNQDAKSPSGAIGLMQIAPVSATDIIFMEKKEGRINEQEKTVLRSLLGEEKLNQILKMSFMGQRIVITEADLYNPQLNILIGSIYLGLLIDRFTTINNTIRLDKVAVQYNMGWFANAKGATLIGDIESLVSSLNRESSSFILKLLGTNGILVSLFS